MVLIGEGRARSRLRVVVAGASGFVGRALVPVLAREHDVVALSRSVAEEEEGVEWRGCDLFSLLQTEAVLEGADVGIYLVHSMLPARLTQASFVDMDLILADNFARSAARAGVRQIIYLGGLVPEGPELSRHLASRLEVERVLGARGVPVTALRAGLIVGAGGSSFRMMVRLVRRLPLMVCPKWTTTRTQPVGLADVTALLAFCVGREETFGRTFDIGAPQTMSYVEMMQRVGEKLGRVPKIVTVPFLSPRLSVAWICLVTGARRELVRPLVESLRHEMVCRNQELARMAGRDPEGFDRALDKALAQEARGRPNRREWNDHLGRVGTGARERGYVVSIQRLPLPPGRDAWWVAKEYARWLPKLLRHVLRVTVDAESNLTFWLSGVRIPLLILRFSAERSTSDRPLFYIEGGWLAVKEPSRNGRSPARLEFRSTPDGGHVMAAIFNYRPRLPWWIYRLTQAPVHLAVMRCFGRHLEVMGGQTGGSRAGLNSAGVGGG